MRYPGHQFMKIRFRKSNKSQEEINIFHKEKDKLRYEDALKQAELKRKSRGMKPTSKRTIFV